MGFDVLRTGTDGDLALGDVFVEDTAPVGAAAAPSARALLAQHVKDLLQFQRGEDVENGRNWIDWLAIRQSKMAPADARKIGREMQALLATIPTWENVAVDAGRREGRTVLWNVSGTFQRTRVDAEVARGLPGYTAPGAADGAEFYFVARR